MNTIDNKTIENINQLITDGKEPEAKKAYIDWVNSQKIYDPTKTREFTEVRDKALALEAQINNFKSVGDVDELKRLADLGREAENKNKTAEQKQVELEKQLGDLRKELETTKSTLTQKEQAVTEFWTNAVETALDGLEDTEKERIKTLVADSPLAKQPELIRAMRPSDNKTTNTTPNTDSPNARRVQAKKVSSDEVESHYKIYQRDGLTRDDVQWCLETGYSFLQKAKEKRRV